MDCSICWKPLRQQGNTTCWACYAGARKIINLMNKLETDNGDAKDKESLLNASEWVVGLTEQQNFLHEMVEAYRNLTPPDILLRPGNNGSAIAAHRALLAARSEIFKNMLESDTCKAPHMENITLSELNHEELDVLLEFLYHGNLPKQKLEKHMYPLSLAAHKYEIIHLQKFSQNYMLRSLHTRNALLVLEVSDFCSLQTIKDNTVRFIVKHARDITLSSEYEVFAVKHPLLSLQITRALSRNDSTA